MSAYDPKRTFVIGVLPRCRIGARDAVSVPYAGDQSWDTPHMATSSSLTDEFLYQIGRQKQDHRAQRRRDNSADNASAQG
jgi:hypothetical protein